MWGTMPPKPDRNQLQSVCCQECGEEIALVHPDEVAARLASGEYVTRRAVTSKEWGGGKSVSHQDGIFGICRKCRHEQATRPVNGDSAALADAQMNRIRDYVAEARRTMPRITLEGAVKLAIQFEFSPNREANRDFRAYLLGEGAPKDPKVDEIARRFMANLPENSLVAPADNPVDWGNE